MDNSATGKLLVCFFLILSSGRIFFIKKSRIDVLCMLSLLSFMLSILDIIAYGIDIVGGAIFLLALLAFMSNIRALQRFFSQLYVDRYSVPFVITSVIVLLGTLCIASLYVYFRPVRLDTNDFNVSERVERMSGSFRSGFVPSATFEKAEVIFTVIESKDKAKENTPDAPATETAKEERTASDVIETQNQNQKPIVMLIPDKRGDTFNYRPYMMLLAQKGYTVISADFFADESRYFDSIFDMKFLRRFVMRLMWIFKRDAFDERRSHFTRVLTQEIAASVQFVRSHFEEQVIFLVSDDMSREACSIATQTNSTMVKGVFHLDDISEYETTGFGCLDQTNPLIAKLLFNIERDKTFFIARYLAIKTDEAIQGHADWHHIN